MTTTRADAIAELFEDLGAIVDDGKLFDYPPSILQAPSPHVAIVYGGSSDTEFVLNVQVVAQASKPNTEQAYKDWLTLVQAVDAQLKADNYRPPGDTSGYDQAMDAWTCVFPIEYPRDDFS